MTQNVATKLLAINGKLFIPKEAIHDPLMRSYHTEDTILLRIYPEGDCDSIAWPEPDKSNLLAALYDAEERGLIPPGCQVQTPDGNIVYPEQKQIAATDLPCYAVYQDDYHYANEWGNKLIELWIDKKRTCNQMTHEQFQGELRNAIIEASDWPAAFRQACAEVGADPDDEPLYLEYVDIHRGEVFNLIPTNLHAEFCWVPDWDGNNLDNLMEQVGLQSERYRDTDINLIKPGSWLETFLRLVNQSSEAVTAWAIENRDGQSFADKCKTSSFKVEQDSSKPVLMTPEQVVVTIENAYMWAVPMFHCEINVRALFEHDHTRPMRLTSKNGTVHLGLHDGVLNGSGYMDTYQGEVVIPADATGFAGESRWHWGINKVYGIVKSSFYAKPATVGIQPSRLEDLHPLNELRRRYRECYRQSPPQGATKEYLADQLRKFNGPIFSIGSTGEVTSR